MNSPFCDYLFIPVHQFSTGLLVFSNHFMEVLLSITQSSSLLVLQATKKIPVFYL